MYFLSSIRSCPRLLTWLLPLPFVFLISCTEEDCVTCPPPEDPAVNGWFLQETPTNEALNNLFVINDQTVIAVGPAGTIVRTGDSGATWNLVSSGTLESLQDVFFFDSDRGWVVGTNGLVLASLDGGITWTTVPVQTDANLREVSFVSPTTGWVAGGPIGGDIGDPVILKTIDGGLTWESQEALFTIRTMFATSTDSVFGAGGASFMRTTDGGSTWTEHDCGPIGWIGCLYFSDSLQGWVSGGAGFMAATKDGGVTWERQNSGTTRNIVEHFFLDENQGWYVGRTPEVIGVTTDGSLN